MTPRARRPPVSLLAALAAMGIAFDVAAPAAPAQSMDLHGRLELQDGGDFARSDSLDAALGVRSANDALANLRLTWEPVRGAWSLVVHGVIGVEDGPEVIVARAEQDVLATPPATWLPLSGTVVDSGQTAVSAGIDRLSLAYSTPGWVARVGRQALTWGSGLVFRPMDLFDPFSPSAVDTEYKPGADMVYFQRLFANGSDLQVVLVPRAPRSGAAPTANDSSAALHFQTVLVGHQTTWLLARDHGDWTGALGVNGALAGATWNLDVVPTAVRREGVRVSSVANISDALTLFGRNATVFAEYFRNGFGAGGGVADYADLPPDLKDRLARGQVFDIRRDEMAAGLTLEVSPLMTVNPTLIADLDDGSLFALLAATWSLGDNLTLIAGAQAPVGAARTEFGGLPLSPGGATLLAPPGRVYLQLRRYF